MMDGLMSQRFAFFDTLLARRVTAFFGRDCCGYLSGEDIVAAVYVVDYLNI